MLTREVIADYFLAEKSESRIFLGIGISSVILALAAFLWPGHPFFRGAAIPLLGVGLIQVAAGLTIYRRSEGDKRRVEEFFMHQPARLKSDELPRMKKVNRNFVFYRWLELAMFVAGMILGMVNGTNPGRSFWYGLGIALCFQAAVLLLADYQAEKRALHYTRQLRQFIGEKH